MVGILDEFPARLEDHAAVSVDVLLVRTFSSGNLGSAARACKAFGAGLLLLDLRADASHPDAHAFASGAEDLFASAPRLSSWDEAERGASALLALTTLRGRSAARSAARVELGEPRAASRRRDASFSRSAPSGRA